MTRSMASGAPQAPNAPANDGPDRLTIAAIALCALVPGALWLVLNTVVAWDPALWYLNWIPGGYALHEFASNGMGTVIVVAMLLVGIVLAFAKNTPGPAITAALMVSVMVGMQNDGVARWFAQGGLARTECFQPGTRTCVLNDFHRMYDLGWSRSMTPAETAAYAQYAALRERAKLARPDPHWNVIYGMRQHWGELNRWSVRFAPELDSALAAFPPAPRDD